MISDVDRSLIGRTPRSRPAIDTRAFTPIREGFADLPGSEERAEGPLRSSFDVEEGLCEG